MWWDWKAFELQRAVRKREQELGQDYSEQEVRRATVHTREDVIVLVSHASSHSKYLSWIRLLLLAIVGLLTYIAWKLQ